MGKGEGGVADLYDFSLKSIMCQFIWTPHAGGFVGHKYNEMCTHTVHVTPGPGQPWGCLLSQYSLRQRASAVFLKRFWEDFPASLGNTF